MASVDVPWAGLLLAANLQHFSGKPWAATTVVRLAQGEQRILLEPRGTRRLSAQTCWTYGCPARSTPTGWAESRSCSTS
jgi:hypothetical protein